MYKAAILEAGAGRVDPTSRSPPSVPPLRALPPPARASLWGWARLNFFPQDARSGVTVVASRAYNARSLGPSLADRAPTYPFGDSPGGCRTFQHEILLDVQVTSHRQNSVRFEGERQGSKHSTPRAARPRGRLAVNLRALSRAFSSLRHTAHSCAARGAAVPHSAPLAGWGNIL